MAHSVLDQTTSDSKPRSSSKFGAAQEEINQFDYRPMPIIVPVSMTLAIISGLALMGIVGVGIAFVSTIVGIYAWRVVSASDGTFSGLFVAKMAFFLSLAFFGLGVASQVHAYNTEVPEGYRRVSFSNDISAKGFVMINGMSDLSPDVKPLINQKVFLKGYIYPPKDGRNVKEFLLLKDTGECCFGGKPSQTDMILVTINDGRGIAYQDQLIRMSVAGTLRFDPSQYGDGLMPVYQLDVDQVDHVTVAKTSF